MLRSFKWVVTTLCLTIMLATVLSACSINNNQLDAQPQPPTPSAVDPSGERVVYLLQPNSLRLLRYDAGKGPNNVEQLLNLLVNTNTDDLISPIPEGVTLKFVSVEEKIVTIEVDAQDTLHWGTRREAVLFDGIVLTLLELPEIDAVRFIIKEDRYQGRIDLSEPFDRDRLLAPQESYEPY